jgi:hypothetical protein
MRPIVAALALLIALPVHAGEILGPSQCQAAKAKAAGAYAKALAGCQARGIAKGVAPDAACAEKALAKLRKAFERAEKKDDCIQLGNSGGFRSATSDWIEDWRDILITTPRCCSRPVDSGAQCLFAFTESECQDEGGTLADFGDSCGVGGTCQAIPSGDPGSCCQAQGECFSGLVTENECTMSEGTFFPAGQCLPSGACAAL